MQFTRLRNMDCPYCGAPLKQVGRSRDHVIGMNFVPRGAFTNEWNLIVTACPACNGEKSALEDDISSITLLAFVDGGRADVPPEIASRANVKAAKSRSRLTSKAVAESSENISSVL